MTNDIPMGLPANIQRLGGLAASMDTMNNIPPHHEQATVTDLYRLYERLAVNSEHTQADVKELRGEVKEGLRELTRRVEFQGDKQISKQEFDEVKRDTKMHRVWLIVLSIVVFAIILYIFLNGM